MYLKDILKAYDETIGSSKIRASLVFCEEDIKIPIHALAENCWIIDFEADDAFLEMREELIQFLKKLKIP